MKNIYAFIKFKLLKTSNQNENAARFAEVLNFIQSLKNYNAACSIVSLIKTLVLDHLMYYARVQWCFKDETSLKGMGTCYDVLLMEGFVKQTFVFVSSAFIIDKLMIIDLVLLKIKLF